MLPNNSLEICGRCDTLVRIRGYSVELQVSLINFFTNINLNF